MRTIATAMLVNTSAVKNPFKMMKGTYPNIGFRSSSLFAEAEFSRVASIFAKLINVSWLFLRYDLGSWSTDAISQIFWECLFRREKFQDLKHLKFSSVSSACSFTSFVFSKLSEIRNPGVVSKVSWLSFYLLREKK